MANFATIISKLDSCGIEIGSDRSNYIGKAQIELTEEERKELLLSPGAYPGQFMLGKYKVSGAAGLNKDMELALVVEEAKAGTSGAILDSNKVKTGDWFVDQYQVRLGLRVKSATLPALEVFAASTEGLALKENQKKVKAIRKPACYVTMYEGVLANFNAKGELQA